MKAFAVLITAVELQRKVQAIKRIREITGVGLAQGKTMAEQLPSTVVDSLYRWQARFLAARLRDIGMTVEVVEDSVTGRTFSRSKSSLFERDKEGEVRSDRKNAHTALLSVSC